MPINPSRQARTARNWAHPTHDSKKARRGGGVLWGTYFNFSNRFIHKNTTRRAPSVTPPPGSRSPKTDSVNEPVRGGKSLGGEQCLVPGKSHDSAGRAPGSREGATVTVNRLHALTLNMLLAAVIPAGSPRPWPRLLQKGDYGGLIGP